MSRCDTYAFGNCTRGACELAPWIPEGLGDGGDWARDYLLRGGQVTQVPTPGSVVCYCRGDGYSVFGHVGYVLQVYPGGSFLVREMNFAAFNAYDDRVSSLGDVCGFLLAPGAQPGLGSAQAGGGPGGGLDDAQQAWADLAGWWNTGAPYWVESLNVVSNLIGQV